MLGCRLLLRNLRISDGLPKLFSTNPAKVNVINGCVKKNISAPLFFDFSVSPCDSKTTIHLPTFLWNTPTNDNSPFTYTLPTRNNFSVIRAPAIIENSRIFDPAPSHRPSAPVSCPLADRKNEMLALFIRKDRVKKLRWIHVRKKHHIQRFKEQRTERLKRRREKLALQESKFRQKIGALLTQALAFDPEKYVKETLERAKWTPTPENTPRMKSGVHWSQYMSIEQLYGLPDSDYIDKKDGFAADEDWQKILELRKKYETEYKREK